MVHLYKKSEKCNGSNQFLSWNFHLNSIQREKLTTIGKRLVAKSSFQGIRVVSPLGDSLSNANREILAYVKHNTTRRRTSGCLDVMLQSKPNCQFSHFSASLHKQETTLNVSDGDLTVSSVSKACGVVTTEKDHNHDYGYRTSSRSGRYGRVASRFSFERVAASGASIGAKGEKVVCGETTGLQGVFTSGRDCLSGARGELCQANGTAGFFPPVTEKRVRFASTLDFQVGLVQCSVV